jgi:serine/threonine-protein kinase
MAPEKTSTDSGIPAPMATIGGHYRLRKKLGEGAFGEVYEAQHELLEQQFAVKILKPELCEDQDVRNRFLDEARALIRFSHPNVVQLRHVGEHEGRLYLVMDLVRGEPLNEVMKREGAFEEARAVEILLQVLMGLAAAHAAGIVHRDLKPSNILFEKRPDGTEKISILDFGLSKLGHADGMKSAHRSVSGSIIGTLAYMSPEQLQGDSTIDGRSDVFAAGIMLHEMLQGHHPYPGESGIMVAAKLLRDPIPPLDPKRASKISDSTKAALAQALERDRDARFASATAFANALEGKGPPSDTSRVQTIEHARQELARADAKKAREKALQGEKKKRTGLLVGVLALLAAAGAGWYFALGPGSGKGTDGGAGGGASVARAPGVEPAKPPVGPGPEPVSPPPEPKPPDPKPPNPVTPEPAKPPVAPVPKDPDPAEPGPSEPVAPEPGPKEPTPEPGPTDPAPPEPKPPEPKPPEPKPPEPVVVKPPVPENPTKPGPAVPPEPTATPPATAEARAKQAEALLASGRWAEGRALWQGLLDQDVTRLDALRGAAVSFIREADVEARSGRIPQALALLDQAVQWLLRKTDAFEKIREETDALTRTRLLGYSLMYRAEAHTDRARWLAISGDAAKAKAEQKAAESDFEFSWQHLQRDGVHYWEFLLRRGEFHQLQGKLKEYVDDVAWNTQTANNLVPAHMWIAHAKALRRVAEAAVAQGKPEDAAKWAEAAKEVAKKGEQWQGSVLTQDQWLEMARVVFLGAQLQATEPTLTPLDGLLGYYVKEATKAAAPADFSAERSKGRVLAAQAARALVEGRLLRLRKNETAAAAKIEAARVLAEQAIQVRDALARSGGLLPESFPFQVLAEVLSAQGKRDESVRARQAAAAAAQRNPD